MMGYLLYFVWAASQIAFTWLLFGSFLERKCEKGNMWWFLAAAWLCCAFYQFVSAEGIYAYLVYLLMAALMLLCVYGETSAKAVFLLLLGLAVVVCCGQLPFGKLLPLLCGLVVRYFRRHHRGAAIREVDDLLLRQHMEMQQESMRSLEQNYRLQRKSAHEFEHHMQVLRDLLERGEVDAAREYLARLKKNRSLHVINVSSNHPVVDVILNQKYQTARENEIKMQIRVNDLSAVQIPSDSLVVVLTNLLDNAVEACRRVDGYREIFCSILYDDALYISIRNTSRPVQLVDGKIPTSKSDPLSHGYGLISVSSVLEQLGADFTFGYDEGWFEFAAEIHC